MSRIVATPVSRESLAPYEQGATATFALASDPRFSFCLYVPEPHTATDILVVVHGSYRNFQEHRDQFADFAKAQNCIVVAPLFPIGVLGDGNVDGFKYLIEGDIRYDRLLLSIIEQVSRRYGADGRRVGLVGFSGGAHFAHRFLILHPQRLWGVSIGAPGSVTLLDNDIDWWPGIGNLVERFGIAPAFAEMAGVPVQMLVGSADLDTDGIAHAPGARTWLPGAERAGADRPERLATLRRSFEARDIAVQFDTLAGIGHEARPIFEASKPFLAQALATHRAHGLAPQADLSETT